MKEEIVVGIKERQREQTECRIQKLSKNPNFNSLQFEGIFYMEYDVKLFC